MLINITLILSSNFLMNLVCDFKVSDKEESMNLNCAWGIGGEILVGFVYRLLHISFVRALMTAIQMFNNIAYELDLF
jgi:hypothetical protein